MAKRYELGHGYKLFDGSEPEQKTYDSLEWWVGAYTVEYEEGIKQTLKEARKALNNIAAHYREVYEAEKYDDGVYWFTLDRTYEDGYVYSVDTIVWIRKNGVWKKVKD